MRTRVAIIGAGPAGLVLSQLLHLAGIESVVLEARDRDYVERRVRAGVLEHGTVELLQRAGVAERLERERLVHHGIELRFAGRRHRIPISDLTGGKTITVYGQQEIMKDLIRARLAAGGTILFGVDDVSLHGLTSAAPSVRFRYQGEPHELHCDLIAGCDGDHGVSRDAIPAGAVTHYQKQWPFAWLGILAEAAPATDEVLYGHHERGFALHSMRSPRISRLYLQVDLDDTPDQWPDDRIWRELHLRLGTDDGWRPNEGPVLEKGITAMRSSVIEPMQYGRLFIAGDAAHIVPPTGAKGLNLAVADARVLAEAIVAWDRDGRTGLLDEYSAACLRRVWRAEHFSWWMTWMLHRHDDDFTRRLQLAELAYVTSSTAAATSLAENYVGLGSLESGVQSPESSVQSRGC
jgi:p-hydroxybenzoate 3-monooxygenase